MDEVVQFAREYIDVKAFRTIARKKKIREAYESLTGKKLELNCSTCYIEALFEIIKNVKMATPNYELRKGVLLEAFGDASKTCTNATLTDELAEWYLTYFPEKAIYFSKISPDFGKKPLPEVKKEELPPVEDNPVKLVNDVLNPPNPELNAKQQNLKDLNDSINKPDQKEETKEVKKKVVKKQTKKAK